MNRLREGNAKERDKKFLENFYQEFHHPGAYTNEEEDDEGITFFSWCCFLRRFGFLSLKYDHQQALKMFSSFGQKNLNAYEVKQLLTNFCKFWYGEGSISPLALHAQQQNRGRAEFDVELFLKNIKELEVASGHLYQASVIEAVYNYIDALKLVFWHFTNSASDRESMKVTDGNVPIQGSISLRNICKFLMAVKVIPDFIVAAELTDLARLFMLEKHSNVPGQVQSENDIESLDPATLAMFEFLDHKKAFVDCDVNPTEPFDSNITSEPTYTFPNFVEFLVALVLYVPPSLLQGKEGKQVGRIQSAFEVQFKLPTNENVKNWQVSNLFDTLSDLEKDTVLDQINNELPPLPAPPTVSFQKKPDSNILPYGTTAKNRPAEQPVQWGEITYVEKAPVIKPRTPGKFETESQINIWCKSEKAWEDGTKYPWQPDERFVLIDEPLLPPPCEHEDVTILLDASSNHRLQRNFDIALYNLSKARAEWIWQSRASSSTIAPPGWRPRDENICTSDFEYVGKLESLSEAPKVGDVLGPVDDFWQDWFKGPEPKELPPEADLFFWLELSTLLLCTVITNILFFFKTL